VLRIAEPTWTLPVRCAHVRGRRLTRAIRWP